MKPRLGRISMKPRLGLLVCLLVISSSYANSRSDIAESTVTNYLKKPTGRYGVGFQDFHWINQKDCPDVNFKGNNQDDFSPRNTKHCHEIVARIYYPTETQHQPGSSYYPPFIASIQQDILKQLPAISKIELEQLTKIKSFSIEKTAIIKDKQFPILLFSPGFGSPAEEHENFITELVSQGYIVVGINTPFINLVALPNGHVVKPVDLANVKNIDKYLSDKLVPLQSQDLIYVYNKLHKEHYSNSLFSSMDLGHMGAFGHSIGAWTLVDVAYNHPSWFKAIVPLDIGEDKDGKALKKFTIPVMYQICSTRQLEYSPLPVTFDLGHNGYLVVISPTERTIGYSQHNNFSDLSTLQYQPAITESFNYYKKQQLDTEFDFKLMSHYPTKKDTMAFHKTTYVLFKQENNWHLVVYFINPNQTNVPIYFDINRINGLQKALFALPNKPIESLSDSEIEPIKKIVVSLIDIMAGALGTGNGWEITASINTYLVQFFNMYLKGEENPAFNNCIPLITNTYIKCGPGIY